MDGHTQIDAGNNKTRRPKLASGKKHNKSSRPHEIRVYHMVDTKVGSYPPICKSIANPVPTDPIVSINLELILVT